jgi:hypothetical protein
MNTTNDIKVTEVFAKVKRGMFNKLLSETNHSHQLSELLMVSKTPSVTLSAGTNISPSGELMPSLAATLS